MLQNGTRKETTEAILDALYIHRALRCAPDAGMRARLLASLARNCADGPEALAELERSGAVVANAGALELVVRVGG